MPTLIESFNWGRNLFDKDPDLIRQLSTAYNTTASTVNGKVSKYVTNGTTKPNVDPPASSPFNKNWDVGDIYVRVDTNRAWIMSSRTTSEDVIWTLIT